MDSNTRRMTVWRAKILTTTWLSYAGFYFCRKNYFIVKDDLAHIFQVDNFALAQIFTGYLVAYTVGQFMTAYLGRRRSARILLLGGMALTLVINLAFGFTALMGPAGYYPMMALMVINGLAQATGWPGNVSVLGNWLPRAARGRVMGLWSTSYQLGSAFAKSFAAWMLAWLGISWSFWGASIVLFGIWIVFYFYERDKPEDVGLDAIVEEVEIEVADNGHGPTQAGSGAQGHFMGMSRSVFLSVLFIGCTYFVFKFCRYALDSWGPMMVKQAFGTTGSEAGYISAVFDWVGFLGVIFGGWFSDKLFKGRRHQTVLIMTIGMVLALIGLATVGSTSIWLFGFFLALTGFMLMGPDSLLSGVGAVDVGGRDTAIVAAGIINGLGSVGPVFQEQIIGWMSGQGGFQSTLVMLVFVGVLGVGGTAYLSYRSYKGLSNL